MLLSVTTNFFIQRSVINVPVTLHSALLAGTPVTDLCSCQRSILPCLGPPDVAIDGNMDFPDVETNIMELRKDFVSEEIALQLSGTRLNLLPTE